MGQGQLRLSVWTPQSGPEVWELLAQTAAKAHMQSKLAEGLEGAAGARAGPCRTAGDLKSSSEWQ